MILAEGDLLLQFAQAGVAGLVVIGFVLGWFWPKPSVDKLLNDNEHLRNQRDELIRIHQTETIPTLARANELLAEIAKRRRQA